MGRRPAMLHERPGVGLKHDPEKWVPVFRKRSCSKMSIETERHEHPSNIGPRTGVPRGCALAMGAATGQPQLDRIVVYAAGGGVPDPVSGLSAWARYLDELYRRAHRPCRRFRRAGQLRLALGRRDLLARGLPHPALNVPCD